MRSGQYYLPIADLAIYYRSGTITWINVELFCVIGQDFNTTILVLVDIHIHTTTIEVSPERLRQPPTCRSESSLIHSQLRSPCPSFAVIHEARESQTPADTRIKSQLTITYNLHHWITFHKLAPATSIVAASTKPEIRASCIDIATDPSVALSVKSSAIGQVCTSRHYKESACGHPWLVDDSISVDWEYGVVW